MILLACPGPVLLSVQTDPLCGFLWNLYGSLVWTTLWHSPRPNLEIVPASFEIAYFLLIRISPKIALIHSNCTHLENVPCKLKNVPCNVENICSRERRWKKISKNVKIKHKMLLLQIIVKMLQKLTFWTVINSFMSLIDCSLAIFLLLGPKIDFSPRVH